MSDWKLRKLEEAELDALYAAHIEPDFPSAERPSLRAMHRHMRGGIQTVWMMTDGGTDAGYAVCADAGGAVLVTLLAVYPHMRGGGRGGMLMRLLKEQYAHARGIVLEVEDPMDAEDDADRTTRGRRIAFYERAGYHLLDGVAHVSFGVRLLLMALPLGDSLESLRASVVSDMTDAYRVLLPQTLWSRVSTTDTGGR